MRKRSVDDDSETVDEEGPENSQTGQDSPWTEEEEDPEATYRSFKNRKAQQRKRAAAATQKLKAAQKAMQTTCPVPAKRRAKREKGDADDEGTARPTKKHQRAAATVGTPGSEDGDEIPVEDDKSVPDYILTRRAALRNLHYAGLKLPPCYEGVEFSLSATHDTRPILRDINPRRPRRDVSLSHGVIPAPIAQWLRDYQLDGARFLHDAFVHQRGVILGDDMGLGKTIQVIAFLTAAFGKTAAAGDAGRLRKVRRMDDGRWYPIVLVICPGGLIQNWQDELNKWGWWQVDVYHGSAADREAALRAARQGRTEIVITTYTTYRLYHSAVNTVGWDCIVADECHTIKNCSSEITKAMNDVNALCRIGLMGTAIQNKYEELWTLLNWANPGCFGTLQAWKYKVSTPLKIGQAHDATHEQLATARKKAERLVKEVLPGVFLRRMKTLIADQLPKKSDRVVFCQVTDTQAQAYRNLLDSDKFGHICRSSELCDCNSGKKRGWCCHVHIPGVGLWSEYVFPCMSTLQKLANHLALLLPPRNDNRYCEDMSNLKVALPGQWEDVWLARNNALVQSHREYCGKWKVLKKLLDLWYSNGDKVLVFSHSVRLLRLLKALFDVDGTKYNFCYLDGGMSYDERAQTVASFNADARQFVFLVSSKAGGVGLNITSANKVVVVDPSWNPAYDLQAQDRAYRIGQTRDVEVFRLVSAGTIEEIIYARQVYKQQQANIGYSASLERRYFKGVMDQASKKGELFGLENLFTFGNCSLLHEIMHQTNIAEVRAGVHVVGLDVGDEHSADDQATHDAVDNDAGTCALEGVENSTGTDDSDIDDASPMKKVAELFRQETSGSHPQPSKKRSKGIDPVRAILEKAGVQYTHENSEVIGKSRAEEELSRKAMLLSSDFELGQRAVFDISQRQKQSAEPFLSPLDRTGADGDRNIDRTAVEKCTAYANCSREQEQAAAVESTSMAYRFRTPEDVRRRQFGEIAKMQGYEDLTEFALVVEDMTQDERRQVLERFYARRRKELLTGCARRT